MDVGLIIAIVGSAVAIIGVMIAMFLWTRGEANDDRRCLSSIQLEHHREFVQIYRNLEDMINEMKVENKDFHYRLLEIERSRIKT